ncbi:hypothetical protein IAR55_000523 [Kwoniella newhampshirensis]|uniref:Uncharacterized protein n=1 Tax=Kwoniella newhampshirensis TaxID=1651941 RepID=A0AAW0Z7Q3_9TREE
MYPTRPAPSPPRTNSLPANHPFATSIPSYRYTTSNASVGSFQSSIRTPITSSPFTPASSHRQRGRPSPTVNLAKPLTPSRRGLDGQTILNLGHPQEINFSRYDPDRAPSSPITTSPTSPTSFLFSPLPTELSIFDPRPRQTLLKDIEVIVGKKLHFPFMERIANKRGSKKETTTTIIMKKENRWRGSRRMTNRKGYDEDWDIFTPDDAAMIQKGSKDEKRKYRGVREGNWV